MSTANKAPVITIDGPSGSGKSTLAAHLAKRLGWHFLNSGALYRVLALASLQQADQLQSEAALVAMAANLDLRFAVTDAGVQTWLDQIEVGHALLQQTCANRASEIAVLPAVRAALVARQHAFQQPPGLVCEGRDMGTVIFPHATLKVFLHASAEVRAKRRVQQLQAEGIRVSLEEIIEEVNVRDVRDRNRTIAPLCPAVDAYQLDSSILSFAAVEAQVWQWVSDADLVSKST